MLSSSAEEEELERDSIRGTWNNILNTAVCLEDTSERWSGCAVQCYRGSLTLWMLTLSSSMQRSGQLWTAGGVGLMLSCA